MKETPVVELEIGSLVVGGEPVAEQGFDGRIRFSLSQFRSRKAGQDIGIQRVIGLQEQEFFPVAIQRAVGRFDPEGRCLTVAVEAGGIVRC